MLLRGSLLLCLLSSASSQKTFWGESCPTIPKLTDFELGRYLGVWFEAAKFPAVFQRGLQCVQANYTLLESGSVLVDNSGLRRGASERTHAVGDATVEDAAAGVLAVKFSRWQPRFSNYRVLDTDYESFAVVWSCALDLKLFNLQFLWLLTRQPRLGEDKYDEIVARLDGMGLKTEFLVKTDQSQALCNY